MKIVKKKDFIVIGQPGIKNKMKILFVQAENHDVACHMAEIKNGAGTFMAYDESQAREITKDFQKFLNNAIIRR